YFEAAWRFKHRAVLSQPQAALSEVAAVKNVSAKYLATVWEALTEKQEATGPMAKLQTLWRELPNPTDGTRNVPTTECQRMRDFVVQIRKKLEPQVSNLRISGVHEGSQSFVLWKNRQYAAYRRTFYKPALQVSADIKSASDPDLAIPANEA